MLSKLKAALAKIWSDLGDTWERSKMYLLGLLAIVAAFEWQKIKKALILYASKKELQNAQKQDKVLETNEDKNNQQADALVKKAEDEPNPGDDWYKS